MKETVTHDDLCLAPLRGVTVRIFRNLLVRWFEAPDRAVAPFIPTFAGSRVKPALLKDIDPSLGQALPVVPQVIGKDPAELRTLLRAFREMGYRCADLNAGCPYPFIVKKGRGAGLLRDADALERMLAVGCEELPQGLSVKVRLGLDRPELLLERMALLNAYPLREIAIHARTARQMYAGEVQLGAFGEALRACRHPVVYNGDIRTREDFLRLKARFPGVTRWMIGRGLAVDPFLAGRIRGARLEERDPVRLKGFLDEYLAASAEELHGPGALLGRMKELWGYLRLSLRDGGRAWQAVKICRTADEYRRAADAVFERFAGFVDDDERNAIV